jgi:sugar phosphate isomerase/epimerase
LRFAICNELFDWWDFARVCRFVRSAGYEGIELAPFTLGTGVTTLSPAQRTAIRRTAEDAGLAIVGLHWLLARTEGLHLTSPDAAVRRRTSEYLAALAELSHDLGGAVMVFGSPAQRSLLPGVSSAAAYECAAETLRRAAPAFEQFGQSLCVEPLTRDETDFLNRCDDAVRLIELVNSPSVVLHLDVKSMSSEPTPAPELIRRHAVRTGHFHANDPNRRGPGFGAVDFHPIFAALREAGYNRWVSVEVFDYSPDPETIARLSLDYMRSCQ